MIHIFHHTKVPTSKLSATPSLRPARSPSDQPTKVCMILDNVIYSQLTCLLIRCWSSKIFQRIPRSSLWAPLLFHRVLSSLASLRMLGKMRNRVKSTRYGHVKGIAITIISARYDSVNYSLFTALYFCMTAPNYVLLADSNFSGPPCVLQTWGHRVYSWLFRRGHFWKRLLLWPGIRTRVKKSGFG